LRPHDTKLIAHRGASYDAPENTLAAVRLAWEHGADGVEVDIRLSKDGRIVVIHDDSTKRTGGKDGLVADQTLEELQALDIGYWKGKAWAGERIPALFEVLETVPRGKRLLIELKCDHRVLPQLERDLAKADLASEHTELIGFDLETMAAAKRTFPDRPVLWLCEARRGHATSPEPLTAEELIRQARAAGMDGLNVSASPAVDATFVQSVRASGMRIYAWTVNDADEARRLAGLGIDAITTDRPKWLRNQLGGGRETRV